MPRMTRSWTLSWPVAALALLLWAPGCGPDAKQLKIDELTAENDQLKGELDERDRRINDALVRENDSRSSIDELNQELAKLRADGQKLKDGDGWITTPTFDMLTIPGEILFASGKADLTSAGRSKLSQVASDIRSRYPDRDIYVFGHTDDQPIRKSKWKDNWELGASRSNAVIRTLQSFGISGDSLVQANCGQYRGRATNASDQGRRANRRVEFFAVKRNSGIIENTAANRGAGGEE